MSAARRPLPPAPSAGMAAPMKKIGLLGGSFNPAHGGHRAISLFARDALGLDEIWWLVSPGNPLKPAKGMAPLSSGDALQWKIAQGFGTRYQPFR